MLEMLSCYHNQRRHRVWQETRTKGTNVQYSGVSNFLPALFSIREKKIPNHEN